ncbi:twin-arginine translocation signal domain-containing protein [Mesorhizobium atlanticum]
MRVDLYEKLMARGASRRDVLKGAASMAVAAAASGAGLERWIETGRSRRWSAREDPADSGRRQRPAD